MTLDGFKDFAKKMRTGKGIGRMRLDVDGDIVEVPSIELMDDDTDEEEESKFAIYKFRTLIICIIYGLVVNINLNSDDSYIRIL